MKKTAYVIPAILACFTSSMMAQEAKNPYIPEIHGTIRAKYEYEPNLDKGRFEVRNARMSAEGKIIPIVRYKAEIDLSDEGQIKMLDAYARSSPTSGSNSHLVRCEYRFQSMHIVRPIFSISPTAHS